MLIFVSDLHLVDDDRRSTFHVDSFLQRVEDCIRRCQRGSDEPIGLVLLGDIFELLKSSTWHQRGIRPWDAPSDTLSCQVVDVLRGIIGANPEFFSGIRHLAATHACSVQYLSGNHDALLNGEAGKDARRLLREALPLGGLGDAPFAPFLIDLDHDVVAEHGHEFDAFNRQGVGRLVPGDLVVVEVVASLPIRLARALNLPDPIEAAFAPSVGFLQELDSVSPQGISGLLAWIEFSMARHAERENIIQELSAALAECTRTCRKALEQGDTDAATLKALLRPLEHYLKHASLNGLKQLAKLPHSLADEVDGVLNRLGSMAPIGGQGIDIFVAGHTHLPVQLPISVRKAEVVTYLNSGTWRRVHRQVMLPGEMPLFHTYREETLVCVYRRGSPHNRRYDLLRAVTSDC